MREEIFRIHVKQGYEHIRDVVQNEAQGTCLVHLAYRGFAQRVRKL